MANEKIHSGKKLFEVIVEKNLIKEANVYEGSKEMSSPLWISFW